jgi:hypothetical protein
MTRPACETVRLKVDEVGRGDRVWHGEPRWVAEQTVWQVVGDAASVTLHFCRALDQPRTGLGPMIRYLRGVILDVQPGPRCAICDQPETLTGWGTFVPCGDGEAHKGCELDRDSDMADDHMARVRL